MSDEIPLLAKKLGGGFLRQYETRKILLVVSTEQTRFCTEWHVVYY